MTSAMQNNRQTPSKHAQKKAEKAADNGPNHDQIDSADGGVIAAIWHIIRLLARPELRSGRPVMFVAIGLTLLASVLEVISPLILGAAINKIAGVDGESPVWAVAALWLLLGIGIRFMAAGLPQLRNMLFVPVSQRA